MTNPLSAPAQKYLQMAQNVASSICDNVPNVFKSVMNEDLFDMNFPADRLQKTSHIFKETLKCSAKVLAVVGAVYSISLIFSLAKTALITLIFSSSLYTLAVSNHQMDKAAAKFLNFVDSFKEVKVAQMQPVFEEVIVKH